MKVNNTASSNTTVTASATASTTPRRGVKKSEAVSLVSKFQFPANPFTLKEIVTAIGADHWYIYEYVKTNGKIVGDAPKAKGSRGPAAKLYQLSK
jgi:hypothetical protein